MNRNTTYKVEIIESGRVSFIAIFSDAKNQQRCYHRLGDSIRIIIEYKIVHIFMLVFHNWRLFSDRMAIFILVRLYARLKFLKKYRV